MPKQPTPPHITIAQAQVQADSVDNLVHDANAIFRNGAPVPPLPNNVTKAQEWASKEMKTRCYTKRGTPDFSLCAHVDGKPMFPSKTNARSLNFPSDFQLLRGWLLVLNYADRGRKRKRPAPKKVKEESNAHQEERLRVASHIPRAPNWR
jgi:hypothetical protein